MKYILKVLYLRFLLFYNLRDNIKVNFKRSITKLTIILRFTIKIINTLINGHWLVSYHCNYHNIAKY